MINRNRIIVAIRLIQEAVEILNEETENALSYDEEGAEPLSVLECLDDAVLTIENEASVIEDILL